VSALERQAVMRAMEKGRRDPAWFFRHILGRDPWDGQVAIAESVRDNAETAVRSCHGIGKDWTAAGIALWFWACHRPSLVLTTGPTDRQVRHILWAELGKAHAAARMPLGGRLLQQELMIDLKQRAIGFTAPSGDPDKFQGWHEEHILAILDEAAGIGSEIRLGIAGCLTSGFARLLEIGNPTDPSCEFAKSFKTAGVSKLGFSAFDTPNFTEFGITEDDIRKGTASEGPWLDKIAGRPLPRPYLVTPAWVASRWHRWGESSPHVQSRILGRFPESGEDQLIKHKWIEAAQRRECVPSERPRNLLACDVARFGSDNTIVGHRLDERFRIGKRRWGQIDTMETSGHIVRTLVETKASEVRVDVGGVGGGVVDRLGELGKPVVDVNFGSSPEDGERFVNKRAEIYWHLRERFEQGKIDIDESDEDLIAQLGTLKWGVNSQGRILIESKKEMKKRGLPSPDDADTCAMAMFDGGLEPSDVESILDTMRAAMGGG
jgi:hypothetical protein